MREHPKCHYCGVPLVTREKVADLCRFVGGAWVCPEGMEFATRDHKMPRARGGADHPSNIVLACRPCNSRKGVTPYEEFIVRCRA